MLFKMKIIIIKNIYKKAKGWVSGSFQIGNLEPEHTIRSPKHRELLPIGETVGKAAIRLRGGKTVSFDGIKHKLDC